MATNEGLARLTSTPAVRTHTRRRQSGRDAQVRGETASLGVCRAAEGRAACSRARRGFN